MLEIMNRTIDLIKVTRCTVTFRSIGKNFCTHIVPKHADVFGQLSGKKFVSVEMDEDEEAEEKFTENEPNDATYTSLFNVCSRWNNKKQALEHLNSLRESLYIKGYVLNNTHYNTMVKAYGMHGDLLTAFQLVDEMKDKDIPIDEITYHSLMHGAISDKECGLRHALAIWHMMRVHGLKLNVLTYNLLLRAIRDTKFGDIRADDFLIQGVEHSRICINESERPDLLANPPVLSTLLLPKPENKMDEPLSNDVSNNHWISCNNVNDVLESNPLVLFGGCEGILSRMEKDNLLPDERTLTMLVELLPKSTSAENALTAYAKRKNIKLNIGYYNTLMKKRCMRQDYKNAVAVLGELQQNHMAPDIITFGVLALSCVKRKQALEVIEGMEAIGYKPNTIIMGTFIKKACVRKNFDYALHMMKYMSKNHIKPTERTLNTLDQFESNVKIMINKGTDKPVTKRILKKKLSQFEEQYRAWKKQWEEK
ncbi:hypothetical protein KM043_007374 [Ampulex compressa]|nr:hypothetical protein KM043_007374 [Ampulex compressa]